MSVMCFYDKKRYPKVTAGCMRVILVAMLVLAGCQRQVEAPKPVSIGQLLGTSPDSIVGIDVTGVVNTPWAMALIQKVTESDPTALRELEQLRESCSLRWQQDVEHLWVIREREETEVVVQTRMAEGTLVRCLPQLPGVAVYPLSGAYEVRVDGREALFLRFFGKYIVINRKRNYPTRDELASRVDRQYDVDGELWFWAKVSQKLKKDFHSQTELDVAAPREFQGSAVLSAQGGQISLTVVFENEPDAQKVANLAKGQLEIGALIAQKWKLGKLVNRIAVSAEKSSVIAVLGFSAQEAKAVFDSVDNSRLSTQNRAPSP